MMASPWASLLHLFICSAKFAYLLFLRRYLSNSCLIFSAGLTAARPLRVCLCSGSACVCVCVRMYLYLRVSALVLRVCVCVCVYLSVCVCVCCVCVCMCHVRLCSAELMNTTDGKCTRLSSSHT